MSLSLQNEGVDIGSTV
jgi:hypothetical protein